MLDRAKEFESYKKLKVAIQNVASKNLSEITLDEYTNLYNGFRALFVEIIAKVPEGNPYESFNKVLDNFTESLNESIKEPANLLIQIFKKDKTLLGMIRTPEGIASAHKNFIQLFSQKSEEKEEKKSVEEKKVATPATETKESVHLTVSA